MNLNFEAYRKEDLLITRTPVGEARRVEFNHMDCFATPVEIDVFVLRTRLQKLIYPTGNATMDAFVSKKLQCEISMRINDLLPHDWKIMQLLDVADLDASAGGGKVIIPSKLYNDRRKFQDFLSTDGSLFVVLHEIGHVYDFQQRAEEDAIDPYTALKDLDRLDPDELEVVWTSIIDSERTSNAYALRTMNKLRQRGIDLEPRLTRRQLHDFVRMQLSDKEKMKPKQKLKEVYIPRTKEQKLLELQARREAGTISPHNFALDRICQLNKENLSLTRNDMVHETGYQPVVLTRDDFAIIGYFAFIPVSSGSRAVIHAEDIYPDSVFILYPEEVSEYS